MANTVLIVDDHAGFRLSARRMLEADGFEVVGEARDGSEAIEATARTRPEIVLLDVYLPDANGFDVASELAALPHPPAVVLTSSHDSDDFGDCLLASSARGFVAKGDLCGSAVAALVA
jgi:DNA-binding NarL/FixJ family response regulator